MPSDYERIYEDNRREYGEGGAIKFGQFTSELLYADRTHFIYELLQNAEDALERREQAWDGKRDVTFKLVSDQLRVEHYGDPFNEDDVKSICEFGESKKRKRLTEIGHFGIGFKSVYAYTSEPRIHSGDEHFAIRDYIFPTSIEEIEDVHSDRTVIEIPFGENSRSAHEEITHGLTSLHRRTLLFLRNIEEISWITDQDRSGQYIRESKLIREGVRRTTLVSTSAVEDDLDEEEWLVLFRPVENHGVPAGEVQVAFLLGDKDEFIRRAKGCTLFARFATKIETHTGFLMDGPYQTTLSRDDVPPTEHWNVYLVDETANLIVDSLLCMRNRGLLDAQILGCLPLDELDDLSSEGLTGPLFEKIGQALSSERLLPKHGGGYISAKESLIPQTGDLRELFSSEQLSRLYGQQVAWLAASVTSSPRLATYVRTQMDVREIRPEEIVRRLTTDFLKDQTDVWIQDLYLFLEPQRALLKELRSIPIARLTDGSHVRPEIKGLGQVYFSADEDTSFRTVRHEVCEDETVRAFLERLGVRKWDRIDHLIENVLAKYQLTGFRPSLEEYSDDVNCVLAVWSSSNSGMRSRLEQELRQLAWIFAVDAEDRSNIELCLPRKVYLATDELVALFGGVGGFHIVDSCRECLVGSEIDVLMKNCDAADSLRPVRVRNQDRFTSSELSQMRRQAYPDLQAHDPWDYSVSDWQLHGLEAVLAAIRSADKSSGKERAELLWNFLVDIGADYFRGTYEWQHYRRRFCHFDSEFLLILRDAAWIRDASGVLCWPCDVVFEELGWRRDEDLIRELKFKAPVLAELANEAGLEVELIRLIQQKVEEGMTSDDIRHCLEGSRDKSVAPRRHQDAESTDENFAAALMERQSSRPVAITSTSPVRLPPGGPRTRESAVTDRDLARDVDGREGWLVMEVSHAARGPEGKALAEEFRAMVEGDYGRRCQICGRTFAKPDGSQQVFIVHVVPPTRHSLSNHFGNLMGLCGWHFALFQHGERCWRTLEGNKPLEDEEQMRALVLNLPEQIDDDGNAYRGLPMRFWNVFDEWTAEPTDVDALVRYSNPHWRYLCELLRYDGKELS